MRTRSTILAVLAAGMSAVMLAGCGATSASPVQAPNDSVLPESTVASLVAGVPSRSVAPLPNMRLAHGLAPPTNKWFSGLVFGAAPLPVFPLPLSFGLTGAGFSFGVPAVHTAANTITGGFAPDIAANVGAASSVISAYDEASVTIDELDGAGKALGSVVVAEGSPLVSFTAKKDLQVRLGTPFSRSGQQWTAKVGDSQYGLVTKGTVGNDGSTLSLGSGQSAVWVAVPKGGDLAKLARYASPVESTSLAYSAGDHTVSTALEYRSSGGTTLVATMPHQRAGQTPSGLATGGQPSGAACDLGSYPSVYGAMSLCAGTRLEWSSPTVAPSSSLDVGKLSAAQKKTLDDQVVKDASASPKLPTDTYFGGKALYRLANLLQLANQLGDTASAATVQKTLSSALARWTEPGGCKTRDNECFVYDQKARGIVGLTASFGSDQFNDHHFHYGYFLYAASVAARYDPALTKRIAPVIDLLVADLATSQSSRYFPERRVFDAYAGHSWASGYSPFADGNNQESSSEAISAWNGLALWASVTKNSALHSEAVWMLSSETASANAYWTNFDQSAAVYRGYGHSIVSLNWGGKRDYATWFSAEPSAKLGILLVPMSPVAGYLAGDPARIEKNVSEGAPSGYNVPLGDYLLMYSAEAGADQAAKALAVAKTLPDTFIDDGNSRSYLLAWIMTRGA
ncbi:MAG: 1,3-beta-glucanase [Microbacteriaceae bacterium]|jgi:endoglucanase Acf2|nr:1,3-beta-glucanase [Microbacteriaceae bacterium]